MTRELHPITWRILQALRAGAPLSRNRHFSLFADPHARQAMRIHRYLRALAKDLRQPGIDFSVEALPDDRWILRIVFPAEKAERQARLTALELRLLAEDAPALSQTLRPSVPASGCDN